MWKECNEIEKIRQIQLWQYGKWNAIKLLSTASLNTKKISNNQCQFMLVTFHIQTCHSTILWSLYALVSQAFWFHFDIPMFGAHNLDDVLRVRVRFLCVYLLHMTSECEIHQMLLITRFKRVHSALWAILLLPEFTIPSTPNAAFISNESIEMFHLT